MKSDKSFNLMTFNVEVCLNLYEINETEETYSVIQEKLENFKNLFKEIDIACIQEDATSNVTKTNTVSTLLAELSDEPYNLNKKVICASEQLDWPKLVLLYGNESALANAIYSKFDTTSVATNKIDKIGLPRCVSVADLLIDNTPIKIASVHLLGGRFDDQEALKNEIYIDEKKQQLLAVISKNPDIICGDFNTRFKSEQEQPYLSGLLKKNLSNIDNAVKSRWSKWINIDEYDALLKQHGYESIYSDLFSNKDTSAYGGIVDYIYYKPSKLRLNSSKIYDDKGVMEKTGTKYKPVLSDHFPVVANFTVIKENSIVRPNVKYYVKNPNGSLNQRSTLRNYYYTQTKINILQEPRSRKKIVTKRRFINI
jgi:endonuclease/exonuclease/phosphatase family metal-dependent hydrolase